MQKLQIGDILIRSGTIGAEQLDRALALQKQLGCRLGDAIVKLDFATEECIAQAVARQIGIPYASSENKVLKPEKGQGLEGIVGETFAREHCVLPLFTDDKAIAVAMAAPDDMMVIENLQFMSGLAVSPFIATRAQILRAIDEFYSAGGAGLIGRAMEKSAEAGGAAAEEPGAGEARLDLDKAFGSAQGERVVSLINAILKQAIAERASDIHLESYDERVRLRFRIDGVLYERPQPLRSQFAEMVSRVKILSRLDIAERRLPQDGSLSLKVQDRVIDVRVSICPTVFGEKVVLRILDKGSANLKAAHLGFEKRQLEDFLQAAEFPHGLIFLTGPTGSGKTTTLYAVLSAIQTAEKNFMTIEDPAELKLEGINQVQVKSQIGLTFASALRSFLRQDPDVILVGEVRDQETAQTCLRAALTGHLVLSTLHTNTALDAVVRLVDLGVEPFLLSSSLVLTAAQRLVRVLCKDCKRPVRPEAGLLDTVFREAMLAEPPDPGGVVFYEARGCGKCAKTGYLGRKGIYEIYPINPEMCEIIYKHGGDLTRLREAASRSGRWNLRASGWRKVLAGLTTAEEVLSVTLAR